MSEVADGLLHLMHDGVSRCIWFPAGGDVRELLFSRQTEGENGSGGDGFHAGVQRKNNPSLSWQVARNNPDLGCCYRAKLANADYSSKPIYDSCLQPSILLPRENAIKFSKRREKARQCPRVPLAINVTSHGSLLDFLPATEQPTIPGSSHIALVVRSLSDDPNPHKPYPQDACAFAGQTDAGSEIVTNNWEIIGPVFGGFTREAADDAESHTLIFGRQFVVAPPFGCAESSQPLRLYASIQHFKLGQMLGFGGVSFNHLFDVLHPREVFCYTVGELVECSTHEAAQLPVACSLLIDP